ncbi:MAG: hypothetical protein ACR2OF_00335 [Hyphomicrobium sp.]
MSPVAVLRIAGHTIYPRKRFVKLALAAIGKSDADMDFRASIAFAGSTLVSKTGNTTQRGLSGIMERGKVETSELRTIGWRKWDPIGLADDDGSYPEGAADEYDSYLIHVAFSLIGGKSAEEMTTYLILVARDHMGLGVADAAAATETVNAIKCYVDGLGYRSR